MRSNWLIRLVARLPASVYTKLLAAFEPGLQLFGANFNTLLGQAPTETLPIRFIEIDLIVGTFFGR